MTPLGQLYLSKEIVSPLITLYDYWVVWCFILSGVPHMKHTHRTRPLTAAVNRYGSPHCSTIKEDRSNSTLLPKNWTKGANVLDCDAEMTRQGRLLDFPQHHEILQNFYNSDKVLISRQRQLKFMKR